MIEIFFWMHTGTRSRLPRNLCAAKESWSSAAYLLISDFDLNRSHRLTSGSRISEHAGTHGPHARFTRTLSLVVSRVLTLEFEELHRSIATCLWHKGL